MARATRRSKVRARESIESRCGASSPLSVSCGCRDAAATDAAAARAAASLRATASEDSACASRMRPNAAFATTESVSGRAITGIAGRV